MRLYHWLILNEIFCWKLKTFFKNNKSDNKIKNNI